MADPASAVMQRLVQPGPARLGLSLAAGIIVLDQLTKWLVLNVLNFSPAGCLDFQLGREGAFNTCGHLEVSPVFDLTMVWNKGVSFGLLGADNVVGRLVLISFSLAVAAALIAGLLGYGPLKAERRLVVLAFGMIIGGAIGNVIDRILFGAVVDFLNFSDVYFPWVFNVADVGINLGVGLIILDMFVSERSDTPDKS